MTDNGRVSTREFYEALLDMRKDLASYHEEVVIVNVRLDNHRAELDHQKSRGLIYDGVNFLGIAVTFIWATITGRQ